MRTHYEVLEVTETASPEVIRGAYRYLSQKWHPDKNPENRAQAELIIREINDAYAVLSDPRRRKEYNASVRREREQGSAAVRARAPEPASTDWRMVAIKRSFLLLLFGGSLIMLLFVLPYKLAGRDFDWDIKDVWEALLLASIAWYSYQALFRPGSEYRWLERHDPGRDVRLRAMNTGAVSGGVICGLLVLLFDVGGQTLLVSVVAFTLLGAVLGGVIGWIIGIVLSGSRAER